MEIISFQTVEAKHTSKPKYTVTYCNALESEINWKWYEELELKKKHEANFNVVERANKNKLLDQNNAANSFKIALTCPELLLFC